MSKHPLKMITVRLRLYDILEDAVTAGIEFGWRRAHKHVDKPDANNIKDSIRQEVMAEFDSVIDFDHGEDE